MIFLPQEFLLLLEKNLIFYKELMKKSEVKTPAKSTTTGGEEVEEGISGKFEWSF